MAETKNYIVTDASGPRPMIAGVRRVVGATVALTDSQAQAELSRGMVKLESEVLGNADADTVAADAAQVQADNKTEEPPKPRNKG